MTRTPLTPVWGIASVSGDGNRMAVTIRDDCG